MNQIIFTSNDSPENIKFENKKKNFFTYKFILFICIFIITICIIIYSINLYNSYKNEKISNSIIQNFNLTKLYSVDTMEYLNITKNNEPFVIGIIEIPKIDITYPILSNTSDELLKIAPCRFSRTSS